MNYEFTEEQKKLQQDVAAFCIKEIAPEAQKLDEGREKKCANLWRET